MQVAYLVNQYPKVSHTFIQREIEGVEATGTRVTRYSIRPGSDGSEDPTTGSELNRTKVILSTGLPGLVWTALTFACCHPLRLLRGLGMAFRIGWRSDRGLLRHLIYLCEAIWLKRDLERVAADHLHAHFGTNPASVALLCRVLGGPPYSFTIHGPDEWDRATLLAIEHKVIYAQFVVVVSSFSRSQLWRWIPYSQWSKVVVVRCGVDTTFLNADPPTSPDNQRFVSVGRLCEQKGQMLLMEAAKELRDRGYNFELVLVGDGPMRSEIERFRNEHKLESLVTLIGWQTPQQVRDWLEQAQIFVLPSFAEGLPVSMMEALALRRPVIGTSIAGIPELVISGHTGWLIPAGSKQALVEAMAGALECSPEKREQLGENGRQIVKAQHDVYKEAERLNRMFVESAPIDSHLDELELDTEDGEEQLFDSDLLGAASK